MKTTAKRVISMCMTLLLMLGLLPQSVFASNLTPAISIDSVTAIPGDTVEMDVSIANNPGILGATLTVSFQEGLTLTKATAGEAFSVLSMTKPGKFTSPCNFVWDGQSIDASDIKDGVILTLTFAVSEDVESGTELAVNLSAGTFVDADLNPVTCTVSGGTVSVIDYIPGDLNGDQEVNITDVILARRQIAGGYEQTIHAPAADVNADGYLDITDVILMRRFIAGGYDVVLKPSKPQHEHTLEATAYKAPTCLEAGNIAYWHCTKCGNYYSDEAGTMKVDLADTVIAATGHTPQVIPAVDATYESGGWTEGSECAVCKEILVAPQPTDPLTATAHLITYDIANGDSYLEKLLLNGQITNPNPDRYDENTGLTLKTSLSVPGYRFLGWYDLPSGDGAEIVKTIDAGTSHDVELYAHWEKITYSVQFKSDVFIEKSSDTYTVDKGVVLPTPSLSNYVFTGWADENGKLYTGSTIPVGSTGDKVLTANWTSERNKAWTKTVLNDPILHIDEENNTLLFVYEIGEMQNVPLYTIKDFGYISGDGITRTASETYSTVISQSDMQAYAKAVANATVQSSNWTLSKDWNEVTSLDEQWCQENGYTKEEAEAIAKSSTNTWNVSSGSSGSEDTTKVDTREGQLELNSKISNSHSHTDTENTTESKAFNLGANLTYTPKNYSIGIKNISASVGGGLGGGINAGYSKGTVTEEGDSDTTESGREISGGLTVSGLKSDTTTTVSSWNNSSSYGGSSTSSSSHTTSTAVSEKISKAYGYGKSYATGGGESSSQGLSSTQSTSDEYSSSVTFSTATSAEVTSEWTTQATKPGYHRWVIAGTAHVFAVVGYDMAAKSYFVYTYSVMDDETYEFEDYSYTSAHYNDQQNTVINFEIPYEVAEYVAEFTTWSDGLKVDQSTGVITGYTGTDDLVVIPEYMNVGNGDIVKITGISSNAFRGNTAIKAVSLSDFITEIPDYAFEGCTSLIGIKGNSVTTIGKQAFSGCTGIVDFGITADVTALGENAFEGVNRIFVTASNVGVVEAAINSGADSIVLYLDCIDDTSVLDGTTLEVPSGTRYFEIYGFGKTYTGLTIISDADKTVLNKADFIGTGDIPLRISSPNVVLNQVTVQSAGIAMVLSAEHADVGLQSTINVTSDTPNTMLCKNIALYEINPAVDGKLMVSDKLLICGKVDGASYLSCGELVTIDTETFEKMQNSCVVYFDANGGTVSQMTASVSYGQAYGSLPIPTKDYCNFTGWYTEREGGSRVTEDTIHTVASDITLYAHWIDSELSDWTLASEVPSDAKIENQKWTYTLREYTTSGETNLSGWTKYDTQRTGWGSTQGPVYTDPSDGYRNVWSEQYVVSSNYKTVYHYFRYSTAWSGGSGSDKAGTSSGSNYYTYDFDYELVHLGTVGNYSQGYRYYYTAANGNTQSGSYMTVWKCDPFTTQEWISDNYGTRWYYQEPVYTYYYYRDVAKESASNPTGQENVSNIQEWVQYRSK